MYKVMKVIVFLSAFSIFSAHSKVLVEIINNSGAGIKIIYQESQTGRKTEKFIENKKSFTTPRLLINPQFQVMINTYKGPLTLTITTNDTPAIIPLLVRGRRFNRLGPQESVPNFEIVAELAAEYPIADARFRSGRYWDEYKILVVLDEKLLENSKVSIAYKALEPAPVRLVPVARPAPAQGRPQQGGEFRQLAPVAPSVPAQRGSGWEGVQTENTPSSGQAPVRRTIFDEQGNPL